MSCLIISSNEPSYDPSNMAERIVYFVDFCSIIKDHGFALVYRGTSLIDENKYMKKSVIAIQPCVITTTTIIMYALLAPIFFEPDINRRFIATNLSSN